MPKKNSALNVVIYATLDGIGKTGDSANISLFVSKDGGTPTAVTNSVTEPSATNAPGNYQILLTATEMDAESIEVSGFSSTASVNIYPKSISTVMNSNLTEIDGLSTAGNNATLNLKQLNIDNDAGVGVVINSDVAPAINIVGAPTTPAINVTSPSTAPLLLISNSTGKDISAKEIDLINTNIGTPIALSGGLATLADNNAKMADNNNGGTFDSSTDSLAELQGQVVAGVPENEVATAQNLTLVGTVVNDYTDTETENDVYMQVSPDGADPFDFYLVYQIEDKAPSELVINARTEDGAGTRGTDVWMYDWQTDPTGVSESWQQLSGAGNRIEESTLDQDYSYILLSKHVSATGEMRVRFTSLRINTTDTVYLDQVIVKAVASGLTAAEVADAVWLQGSPVFYSNAVHVDTVNGVAGNVVGENGTPTNPVDNLVDAYNLSVSLQLPRFFIRNGSQLVLDRDYTGYTFAGTGYSVDLNGQTIAFSKFEGANIIGEGVSAIPAPLLMEQSRFQTGMTVLPAFSIAQSQFGGDVTAKSAGTYSADFCSSGIAGTGLPSFTFVASVNFNLRHYSGGMEVKLMVAGCNMSMEGQGQLIINANCLGGTIVVRGNFDITDNASGRVTIIQTANFTTVQLNASLADITDATVGAIPELSVGKPIATPTLKEAVMLPYMAFRNKKTADGSFRTISNDAGTTIAKAATGDDSVTLIVDELITP